MKHLIPLFLVTFLSCTNQTNQTKQQPTANTAVKAATENTVDNSKYYITEDSITIAAETEDSATFSKAEYNRIVDEHPEFFSRYPLHPDLAYEGRTKSVEFSSEGGQDRYYFMYAYFLKQRNGIDKYAARRSRLIKIYRAINSLFQRFQYGGTYFGHQHTRILGYAEYSVYLYSNQKDNIEKKYDISNQKNLYIRLLRQLIADESKIDFNTLSENKITRDIELNKTVDELATLITDRFYLSRAQEFQYNHYEHY